MPDHPHIVSYRTSGRYFRLVRSETCTVCMQVLITSHLQRFSVTAIKVVINVRHTHIHAIPNLKQRQRITYNGCLLKQITEDKLMVLSKIVENTCGTVLQCHETSQISTNGCCNNYLIFLEVLNASLCCKLLHDSINFGVIFVHYLYSIRV